MTSLYDKLESYLRALEILGVTTEKCASILYPMVESCFQENFLKAWNRSATSTASTDAKERLTNLMTFLKAGADEEGELIHYRHCRVVFGVSSSPYLLVSTIQYLLHKTLEEAKQGRGKYPECIVQKLLSSFYVYICLASVQTQSKLDRFIDVATKIMAERKFYLRGCEHSNPSDPITSLTNVLGMIWDRHCDTLSLNIPDLRELIKLAYFAVVFLRVDIGSTVHIQLVQSKTRIAPCGKKETTIAWLELLGAAITARLSTTVLKKFPTDNVYFWTDSTTVLAWLKREEPWDVFVYNRVQEIRKLIPVKAWRLVPGSLNPTDCPSRGCSAK
ncbi:integrase catalytic domain-containing protein [Trichonephila clavipes]|nr:integrase catalytic domain-containing protein [Trichonephila clavipes]